MSRFKTLAELIDAQCIEHADFNVLTMVDVTKDGRLIDERRTFGELRDNAARLAVWLQDAGVKPGDRVTLMLHNHPEFVEAMIASALIGAIFVPVDPRSLGEKLVYMLNFVESPVVIAGAYALPALADVAGALTDLREVLVVGAGADDLEANGLKLSRYERDLPASGERLVRAEPDPASPIFMMFTSGTTGNPKAVVRSHAFHMAGLKGLCALGVQAGDIPYTGLPLSHINAQATLSAGLAMPLQVVISRRFTKSRLWDICRAYGCTVFTLLGGMIPEIYSVPEQPGDIDNPVRLIVTSGMPAALWDEYRRRFGVEITEVYGSTEAAGALVNFMSEGPIGSMGKPPKGVLATVLGDDGQPCAPGQRGELCFRPEQGDPAGVIYYRNHDASQKKVQSGWYRSGDIAHMDENGWFYFHHRAGGGVRCNGDFVNTSLVETVLSKSPLVEDVFVYGVETARTVAGEKALVAAVVLREEASVEDLKRWCADKLQRNEIPQIWQMLPAIPKTISEKPIERDCIALLEGVR